MTYIYHLNKSTTADKRCYTTVVQLSGQEKQKHCAPYKLSRNMATVTASIGSWSLRFEECKETWQSSVA